MKILSTLVLLVILGIAGFLAWKQQYSGSVEMSRVAVKETQISSSTLPSPTPSPMPFEELTIPYLRNKEYKSTLWELGVY